VALPTHKAKEKEAQLETQVTQLEAQVEQLKTQLEQLKTQVEEPKKVLEYEKVYSHPDRRQTTAELLEEFLSLQDGPLRSIATRFRESLPPGSIPFITEGILFFEESTEKTLKELHLLPPRLFRASLFWEHREDWMAMKSSLICSIDENTEVFMSGEFNGPCTTKHASECFKQLEVPDFDLQYYISNVYSSSIRVRIPDNFDTELGLYAVRPEKPRTTTNLTPKWTRVRPHIGSFPNSRCLSGFLTR
jgi:hypothetical protein